MEILNYMSCTYIADPDREINGEDAKMESVIVLTGGINGTFSKISDQCS